MGYRDVTDRAAVRAAMVEYDELGADAFLARHGFGRATGYLIVDGGRTYDSKAILGVAHGYQFPAAGALGSNDFSGGEATVAPVLEALGFTVAEVEPTKPRRNPNWTRDELILALDLYLREGYLDDTHPSVIELSEVLNTLPIHDRAEHEGTFRNPNGVTMKLGNLARFDPAYPGKGLDAGSKLDQEVWDDFHDRPDELHRLASLLRAGVALPALFPISPEPDEEGVVRAACCTAGIDSGNGAARSSRRGSASHAKPESCDARPAASTSKTSTGTSAPATSSATIRCHSRSRA